MIDFCTYFDHRYLPRALALYHSLAKHCPGFRLFALCMDDITHAELRRAALPNLVLIEQADFERGDTALLEAKQNRSRAEYFFTCTSSLCLFVLKKNPEVRLLTYLDADLFFFSNPQPIFDELGDASIGIIEHRYAPRSRRYLKYGIYNVGWLNFRRDEAGLKCLEWWREQCLEWCYDSLEGDRFADQKYLDDWPARFLRVRVLQHKGANLACWNVANYLIRFAQGKVWADEQPLIFFHFTGVKEIKPYLYQAGLAAHFVAPRRTLRRYIFGPYIQVLKTMSDGRDPTAKQRPSADSRSASWAARTRNLARFFRRLLWRDYLFIVNGRVL